MDYFTTIHLMNLYGLDYNMQPYSFQFPRLPPGLSHPMQKVNKMPKKEDFSKNNESLNIKLQDFQNMYRKFAAGLFDVTYPGIIPPGHPLYTRQLSVETLQSERDKLLKENFELKQQLEKLSKEKKI